MPPPTKLLVITGATATGKTRLGIALAKALGGEVVNADAMQMYSGLDVATAKATVQERAGVPHHLLSHLDAGTDRPYTVVDYRDDALKAIRGIAERGKLPIVVGGTLYYIQSLLWPSLVDETPSVDADDASSSPAPAGAPAPASNAEHGDATAATSPYEELKRVDPEMASRLHPNDSRKVRRSLEVYRDTGERHSAILARQAESPEPRFESRVLWLDCDPAVLAARLAKRVGAMLEQGLLEEARAFAQHCHKDSGARGLFQAMGYKEFTEDAGALDPARGAEKLTRNHIRYSKKQLKWIKHRLLPRNVPVYRIDTSSVDDGTWDTHVLEPGLVVARGFLEGIDDHGLIAASSHVDLVNVEPLPRAALDAKHAQHECEVCRRTIVGENEWQAHTRSRAHRAELRRQRRSERGAASKSAPT